MATDPKLHTHIKLSYLATRRIRAYVKHISHTTHHILQIKYYIETSFKHMYIVTFSIIHI